MATSKACCAGNVMAVRVLNEVGRLFQDESILKQTRYFVGLMRPLVGRFKRTAGLRRGGKTVQDSVPGPTRHDSAKAVCKQKDDRCNN